VYIGAQLHQSFDTFLVAFVRGDTDRCAPGLHTTTAVRWQHTGQLSVLLDSTHHNVHPAPRYAHHGIRLVHIGTQSCESLYALRVTVLRCNGDRCASILYTAMPKATPCRHHATNLTHKPNLHSQLPAPHHTHAPCWSCLHRPPGLPVSRCTLCDPCALQRRSVCAQPTTSARSNTVSSARTDRCLAVAYTLTLSAFATSPPSPARASMHSLWPFSAAVEIGVRPLCH